MNELLRGEVVYTPMTIHFNSDGYITSYEFETHIQLSLAREEGWPPGL